MLELRKYTKSELSTILGTSERQGIRRKLERYGIKFSECGHGNNAVFQIKSIERPFKVFCIIDLGVPAQVDFDKMRDYLYYLFNYDGFADLPAVERRQILSSNGITISNQTISHINSRLERSDYFNFNRKDCSYWAIVKKADGTKDYYPIDHDKYCDGWRIYWETIEKTQDCYYAYSKMIKFVGGHPCKTHKIEYNGIYANEINTLHRLVNEDFLSYTNEN